jgi:hypothetical protein
VPLTDATKNTLLDALPALATHLSLHTAFSITGTNEVTGGSPAYARQPCAWSASSGGVLSLAGLELFDVPAGTIMFVGLWSALTSGTFRGMYPVKAAAPTPFTAVAGTDIITSDAHGFTLTDESVVFWDLGAGSVLPTGITEGTRYFVRDISGDTFKIAATAGGAAIDLTTDGGGYAQRFVPEVFAGQGQYEVTDIDIAATGA